MKRIGVFSLLILIIVIGTTCSVMKRRYQKGFYFGRKSNSEYFISKSSKSIDSSKKIAVAPVYTADNNSTLYLPEPIKETVCDTIYLKNGVKMIVKVTKVYEKKTYYILCDSDNEAEFEMETPKVNRVVYASGRVDSLKVLEQDPYNYYSTPFTPNQFGSASVSEYAQAQRDLNDSLLFVLGGLLFFPLMVVGFIKAYRLAKRIKGKRGLEPIYKKAKVLSSIGIGCGLIMGLWLILIIAAIIAVI